MLAAALLAAGALSRPAFASSGFNVNGVVYDATGNTGTSAEAPSFAGAALYTSAASGEIAYYRPVGPPQVNNPAGSSPANFQIDAQNQLLSGVNQGDTLVVVDETYQGQYGWSGPASVFYNQ
ncbi:MAG TPA: hypothetical protein VNZ54_04880, partial [bacterium]|nr:hypothetical protein [bacterium]